MKKWQKTPVPNWKFSDNFWSRVEPLLPLRSREKWKKYKRKPGAGRPKADHRKIFAGILYVLRTGIQWKALPKEQFGAASSVHRYFTFWTEQGVFQKLWKRWLVEYDEMKGIAWEWQSADGSMNKSPLWKEDVGKNPTDRGKKLNQTNDTGRRIWYPVINRRGVSQ